MKKINLPLLAALSFFAGLLFASCKKDYTCSCRVTVPLVLDTTVNIEMKDYKKKQAKQACEDNNETIKIVSNALLVKALEQFQDSSLGIPFVIPANIVNGDCELK